MQHQRTFIIGSPRSGTTWVAKLFDAHPWVVYRHEPDSAFPLQSIPGLVDSEDITRHLDAAGAYLDRLFDISTVKTNATTVRFPKDYRGGATESLRLLLFLGLRAAEQVPALRKRVRQMEIPDLIPRARRAQVYEVCKSVIAGGRAGLYARARPGIRFILVLRHPAGVVASEIRGKSLGKMPGVAPIEALAATPSAVERGLTLDYFEAADDVEKLTWWWVLFNEKMISDTQGLENCLLVNYDDMCTDPSAALKTMYAHAGIDVSDAVSEFLDKSTAGDTTGGAYFSLFRNPQEASNRWRSELTDAQVARIRAITDGTVPGSHFVY
jgi:hypothetical protein